MDHAGALRDAGDGDRRRRRCSTRVDTALGTVSVVMIACAACSQLSSSRSRHAGGQPGDDALDRQRLHDHAGGKRQHLLGRDAEQRAQPRRRSRAHAASPRSPVPALALPVLTTSARTGRHACEMLVARRSTGAAQKRFRVNTPATRVPSPESINKQILAVGLADAGRGDAKLDAGDGNELISGRSARD